MIFFIILTTLLYVALSIKDHARALSLLPALTPLYLIRLQLGPIPSTLLELLIGTAILFWLYTKPWKRITWNWHMVWLVLPLATIVIGILRAPDTFSAIGIAKAYYLEPILLFFAFRDRFKQEDWKYAVKYLGISATILALYGVFQWLSGVGLPIPYDFTRRITSVFDYPNAYGLFVAPIAVLLCSFPHLTKRWRLLGMCLATTLLLSQTESGLVAVAVTLGFWYVTKVPASHRTRILRALGVCIVALAMFAIPTVRQKLFLLDPSGLVRRSQWQETIELLSHNPIWGVGFEAYPTSLIPYHIHMQYEIFQYPHNLILNAWVEAGIANVLLILFFMGVTGYMFLKTPCGSIRLAGQLAMCTMFIHGLVDVPFYKNDLAILAGFCIALALALNATQNCLIPRQPQ